MKFQNQKAAVLYQWQVTKKNMSNHEITTILQALGTSS